MTLAEAQAAKQAHVEPSYSGTYVGAKRYVLDTFANTKSASMKRKVAQFLTSIPCPACHGKRIKPEALSVTFAGLDIADFSQLPLYELTNLLEKAVEDASHTITMKADEKETLGQSLHQKGEKKLQSQAVTQVNLLLRQNRKLVRLPSAC